MVKNLIKLLETHSNKIGLNKRQLFLQFVEMQYQFTILGSYQAKLRNAEQAFNEYFTAYLETVKAHPFKDVLGELMTELDMLDTGSKSKLCQNLTPNNLSDALSRMLNDTSKPTLADICCGTGVLILSNLKIRLESNSNDGIKIMLNDMDSLMCKICMIQIVWNNAIHIKGQFPLSYIIYNHNTITEYKHFSNGITEQSKVIGCSDPHLITDEVIKRGLFEKYQNLTFSNCA
ncbi:N-6 DNA methylase [Vibrio aestuarianus]|uniref:N-6 DNA methylase n=1 Tax=Vibrio aestuarianus TaxID=28171 RepID=A0A9X4J3B4_9VIBR|nr:N-6 DNA methylase [Vibrio aestuarianus]MDE1356646.1 N-6 DNA methylase [Vibrio aestuarianus]